MMPSEPLTPDSASMSSSIFIVDDDRDLSRDPLVKTEPKFDGNDSKYQCACCCHVWICTLLVGVVELIVLVLNLILTAAAYGTDHADEDRGSSVLLNSMFIFLRSEQSLSTGIVGAVLGFLVVGLLIHGVLKQRHRFLVPHLVVQLLAIVASLITIILFVIGSVAMSSRSEYSYDGTSHDDWTTVERMFNRRLAYRQCVGISVILTCITVLQSSFFVAVLRCYFYLREVQRRVEGISYLPMVAVKGGVPNA